jgi:hypothetical protein
MKNKTILLLLNFIFSFVVLTANYQLLIPNLAYASLPSSTNFKLQNYSFGAGGTTNSTSTNFKLNGVAGEVEYGNPSSTNFKAETGLTYMMKANVPTAPTLSTPGNNYDRIQVIINTSNNPTDATYALEISTSSSFASNNNFVHTDGTLGASLTSSNFQTYTAWGGSSGSFITGLTSHTTYYVRVAARQGNFTQSEWGPLASITTNFASLTFTINNPIITFNNLSGANSYTDSTQADTFTTSTNAFNGYTIYGWDNQPLTSSTNTIANYGSPNSTPTAWSGTGFGYTTNDTNLGGSGGANRFNTGTNYAGFQTSGPGDPVADDAGPVTTSPITNEHFQVSYRVTASNTTPAGKYTNTILYTIVPSY